MRRRSAIDPDDIALCTKTNVLSTVPNQYLLVESNSTCEGKPSDMPITRSDSAALRPIHEIYTHRDIFKIAMVMSPLWFLANCLYNYSLLETSVGSSTIIRSIVSYIRYLKFYMLVI